MQGDEIPQGVAEVNHTAIEYCTESGRVAVPVLAENVHAWLEKTVRGMLYLHSQRFVEDSHAVEFMPFLNSVALDEFESTMDGLGVVYVNGPGVAVRMGVAEDGISSVFVIRLWEQIYMGAAVMPKCG